jgi:hypothetical protein
MRLKPGGTDVLWMAAGAAALLVVVAVVLHFSRDPVAQLASKARRVDLVGRMQLDLASASEAEKSAVLASTDAESQTLADQARAASGRVEEERRELGGLLGPSPVPGETELLAQFSESFAELQRIDRDLLALAVKNTNIKAYALAFGPAAAAITDMGSALTHLAAASTDSPQATATLPLAFGAQIDALHIEVLLPPHIAEESDQKMTELEARMATEDAHVRHDLDKLAALPKVGKDPDLAAARAHYTEFSDIRKQILALSRENTNVRSLSISLNQKRKVMLLCQASLSTLQQTILAEPVAGSTYGVPVRPR